MQRPLHRTGFFGITRCRRSVRQCFLDLLKLRGPKRLTRQSHSELIQSTQHRREVCLLIDLLQCVPVADSELVDAAVDDDVRFREPARNMPLLDELRLPVVMTATERVFAELVTIDRVLNHTASRIVTFNHISFVNGRRGRESRRCTGEKHLDRERRLLWVSRSNDYVLAPEIGVEAAHCPDAGDARKFIIRCHKAECTYSI